MWHKKWIFGNWKMNGALNENNARLDILNGSFQKSHCAVALPYPYLYQAKSVLKNQTFGAQDCSQFGKSGAFTGEVSAQMIADLGASFVLIGHSERRQYFGENNTILRAKIENALQAGLLPLLCVGESLNERQEGRAKAVISTQLEVLRHLAIDQVALAYEPIWAIGTGVVAQAEQIAEIHAHINKEVLSILGNISRMRVLYGGSVNAANIRDILSIPQVDGALIGGASLKAEEFGKIISLVESD